MPRQKRSKAGRPPFPTGHAKIRTITMRVNTDLARAITVAANAKKKSVAEWLREAIEAAIK
jgi:predicted HicB family RNase H-like nuclease